MDRTIREYDKNLTATGNKVVIRRLEKYHNIDAKGIIIPESSDVNFRMTKGEIVSIGKEASDKSSLKVGDIVLYDTLSAFYDHHPIIVTKCENVVCKFKDAAVGITF